MRQRTWIIALATAALLPPAAVAEAGQVFYPVAHPQVSLDVPDGWSVVETPLGLEMVSPQSDALVLAGIIGSDRQSVDGWTKRALARMSSAGVTFAKAATGKPAAAPSDAGAAGLSAPTLKPAEAPAAGFAQASGDHPYAFGGAPTIQAPSQPSQSDIGAAAAKLEPAGAFLYGGGSLRGQPVDVELTVFALGNKKRLLTEQVSGATDARGVTIVRSMRNLIP